MAQGEFPKEDILMQDNQTEMLLEKNYPFSVSTSIFDTSL